MRLSLLLMFAFVATAKADTGPLLVACPKDWVLFRTDGETSCLKIMPEPKVFDEAYKTCIDEKARLLSFSHKMYKVFFVNKMIIDHLSRDSMETTSMWFFDPTFLDTQISPKPEQWMVLFASKEMSKVSLQPNSSVVARRFLCETNTHPVSQRPQFQLEPDHLFIANFLINQPASPSKEEPPKTDTKDTTKKEEPKPFIVTFNCQAYGLPKPSIEWHIVSKADNQSLINEVIDAKVITDPKEPLKESSLTATSFFSLHRDCSTPNKCPLDTAQERSQLIVVNPQFLNLNKRIVCVAKNDFGSVYSHEAQIFVTEMGEFPNKEEKVTVKSGISAVITNTISTKPDSAAADCFKTTKLPDGTVQLVSIEELNQNLQGGIQMSKATFDLIIDAFRLEDAGDYVCRARLHNGRIGHVIKEKNINIKVDPCSKAEGCDLEEKPVKVVQGYPAVLSINPLDNHVIRSGDDFLLECPCSGKRRPDELLTVNWDLKNNTRMNVIPIHILPQGSALLVPHADRETHSGKYYCQCVRGTETSEWSSTEVSVLPSTEPLERKEILTAKVGGKATHICKVNAEVSGLGVFVEPLYGIQTLDDYLAKSGALDHVEIDRKAPNHVEVNFKVIKETDAGVYGCRVTVNFGKWTEYDSFYTTFIVEK